MSDRIKMTFEKFKAFNIDEFVEIQRTAFRYGCDLEAKVPELTIKIEMRYDESDDALKRRFETIRGDCA